MPQSAMKELSGTSTRPQKKIWRARLSNGWNRLARYYPFGVAGTVLLLVALYLLGRSVEAKNAYGLVLALAALFVLFVLALLGRIQAERLGRSEASWDFSPPLYARTPGPNPRAAIDGPAPFLFFRLHTLLRGRLYAGRKAKLSFFRDVATESTHHIDLPMLFPFCGRVEFHTTFHISDIFGLTQSRFGHREDFALPVQPAPFPGSQIPPIQAAGGDRETSRTKQPDEQRYYQREYVPGDRFRDINWKASSRLTQLYTRTSPVTQEQTQLVTVYLRHFVPVGRLRQRESIEQLSHLNVLKSWLIAYLFRVKQDNPEFHFRVLTARGAAVLESEDDIHNFSASISDLSMDIEPAIVPSADMQDGDNQPRREHDSTVFSTAYDEGLSAFLHTRHAGQTTVYRTVFGAQRAFSALERSTQKPQHIMPSHQTSLPRITTDSGRTTSNASDDEHTIRFSVLGKEMFPTLAAFLPLGIMPARERTRMNPGVISGTGIELIERAVVLEV